jgi:hypothetical protein
MINKLRQMATGLFLMSLPLASISQNSDLFIGTATADVTPALPVALCGQFEIRIARTVETPLTANVVILESRKNGRSNEEAIMISCDLISIPADLLAMVRNEVHKRLPMVDVNKLFMNATHTHTAPVLEDKETSPFRYQIPKDGVTQADDYTSFFTQRVADAVVKAWNSLSAGSVTWGLSHAVVGYNRRAIYANGTAKMYGKTNLPEFQNLEGYEDHDVNTLFFWNKTNKLIAVSIEVACPAQEGESGYAVNADFWHPVRVALRKRFGNDLCVLAWTGAAGDQSPHLMYRKAADERMNGLSQLNRQDEIARRISLAVEEAYESVKNDRHTDILLIHKAEKIALPMRMITDAEYRESKAMHDSAAARIAADPKAADKFFVKMTWYGDVLKRYEMQKNNPQATYETEIHVLRIGDAVVCTDQFELFTDYGIRIQSRSKALQTITVQLAGPGSYLPSSKAILGGGYSAICQSNVIGAEGGQILVDRTIKLIDELWPDVK